MINLDNDFDKDLDDNIDITNLIKPKTMHNVKINDWFTMNNGNIDNEWR